MALNLLSNLIWSVMKSELSRNLVIGKHVSHVCYLGWLRITENSLDMLEVSHILILHHFLVLFNLLCICLSGVLRMWLVMPSYYTDNYILLKCEYAVWGEIVIVIHAQVSAMHTCYYMWLTKQNWDIWYWLQAYMLCQFFIIHVFIVYQT